MNLFNLESVLNWLQKEFMPKRIWEKVLISS